MESYSKPRMRAPSASNNKRKTLKERLQTIQQHQELILQEATRASEADAPQPERHHIVKEEIDGENADPNQFRPVGLYSHDIDKLHHRLARLSTDPKRQRAQGCPLAISTGSPEFYNADRFYSESKAISKSMPSSLTNSFNALLQNLFNGASQSASAASLAGSKQVRQQTLAEARGANELTRVDQLSFQHSPTDIRTVYSIFEHLDPETTTYACCPNPACCALYSPESTNTQAAPSYPLRCTEIKFDRSCGTPLVNRLGTCDGEGFLKPTKPFVYHHFNDHVAALLSRSGIEDAIESHTTSGALEAELMDIMSSKAVREFYDPSGRPFLRKDGSELRLVWALAADWYNPYSNKAAGKSVSTGVIAMICLSLPPQLRYLEENMYLAGLIPGPHEPTLDAVNPFLIPLVHDLNVAYHPGTRYSRTHKHALGRICRSAVIPVIADTLASKKVTGYSGHGSKYFCSRCRLPRHLIHDLDHTCWPEGLTRSEHEAFANAWRDAHSKAQQQKLAKKYGIRWSALLLLPYWQPSQWSIQEGFHVLLLGVAPRHCRDLLGLNFKDLPKAISGVDGDDDDDDLSPALMEQARLTLVEGSPAKLHKLTTDVLRALCREKELSLPAPARRGRLRKKDIISVLLGSAYSNQPFLEGDLDLPLLFDGLVIEERAGNPQALPVPPTPSNPAVITQETLSKIREHIKETLRPAWQAHLPENFGSPEHGKLKADQWRTALEFDIPVSLIQILADRRPSGGIVDDAYFRRIVENTLDLSMALAWGLSRRTSKLHAEKYTFYMHRYLIGVQELFPDYKLKPVHHYALHIQDILMLFGPLHGTWAFSVERLIGSLQDINTNSKIGEMEGTVTTMFCRRASLVRWASSNDIPPPLKEAWRTFCARRKLRDLSSGLPSGLFEHRSCSDRSTCQSLDPDIQEAFLATFQPRRQDGEAVYFNCASSTIFHYYEQHGVKYADFHRSEKGCLIYFRASETQGTGEKMYPAQIRTIFEHCHIKGSEFITEIFVAVHRYLPSASSQDHFASFPDFRAGLFCLNPASDVDIIKASQICCHANQRPWDASTVVMRAIDRDY